MKWKNTDPRHDLQKSSRFAVVHVIRKDGHQDLDVNKIYDIKLGHLDMLESCLYVDPATVIKAGEIWPSDWYWILLPQ
jgi:hypothetical protein